MNHPPCATTFEIDMKEPRELKELLKLLLDNINHMYYGGLCILVYDLVLDGKMTKEEQSILEERFDKLPYYTVDGQSGVHRPYKFEPNEKQPRIEWLKQEIKRLK